MQFLIKNNLFYHWFFFLSSGAFKNPSVIFPQNISEACLCKQASKQASKGHASKMWNSAQILNVAHAVFLS